MSINKKGYMALECLDPACDAGDFVDSLSDKTDLKDDVQAEVTVVVPEFKNDFVDELGVAVEMTNRLEEIEQITREAKDETGQLSPLGGRAMIIATEDAFEQVGMDHEGILPPPEAFANDGTAVDATEIAIEALGDSVKKLTGSVMNSVKAVGSRISEGTKKLLTALGRTRERVKTLSAEIEKAEFHEVREIETGKLGDRLHVDGKFPTDLPRAFGDFKKNMSLFESFLREMGNEMDNKVIPAMARSLVDKEVTASFTYPAAPSGMKKVSVKQLEIPFEDEELTDEKYDAFVSKQAPGGSYIYALIPKKREGEALGESLTALGDYFGLNVGRKKEKDVKAKTLTRDEAARLIDVIEAYLQYASVEFKENADYKRLKKLDNIASSASINEHVSKWSSKNSPALKTMKEGRAFFYNYSSMLWYPMHLRSDSLKAVNAALDLIEASMKK